MKDLSLLTVISSADIGGAEIHVEHIVRHVNARHTVVTLADGPMVERYRAAGAEAIVLPAPGKMPLHAAHELDRILTVRSPDVVHTHTPKANLLGAMTRSRLPRVMTIHGSHKQFATSRTLPATWYKWADLWAARGAAFVVAVCEADRRELVAAGFASTRTIVVPNGVPDFAAERPAAEPERRDLVWIGRFSAEKAPEEMVAIARLVAHHPSIGRIRMIGDGPLRGELVTAGTRGLTIEPPRDSLGDIWPSVSVLVNTSRSEGASLTILEALAAGVPVVATAVGGTPELVGRAGVLIDAGLEPAERHAAFAAGIKRLLEDAEFRDRVSREARSRYEERYRVETMASALEEVYRNVGAPASQFHAGRRT